MWLLFFPAMVAIAYYFPDAAVRIARFITWGLIVPFYLFVGGAAVWAILHLCLGIELSYLTCVGVGGAPLALLMVWIIYG